MSASSLLGWALAAAFLLFLARAVSMFVRVQKMPQTAERTNLRARARTSASVAVLCLLISFGLRAFEQAAPFIPQTPPGEIAQTAPASGDAPAGAASAPAALVAAPPVEHALPDALVFNGAPVDPLCFQKAYSMEDGLHDVTFDNCGEGYVVKEYFNKGLQDRGVIFDFADSPGGGMSAPYMQYRYIGEGAEGRMAVLLNWSGGGTGQFSSLLWMKREGDVIKPLETVAGGDRCNGGITEATVEHNLLSYSVNLTPYDLFVLGGPVDRAFVQTVKAYDDLEACAACCYGTAHYRGIELRAIRLDAGLAAALAPKWEGQAIAPTDEKQACFDRIIRLNTERDVEKSFTVDDWTAVVREIEHVCLGRPEGE